MGKEDEKGGWLGKWKRREVPCDGRLEKGGWRHGKEGWKGMGKKVWERREKERK